MFLFTKKLLQIISQKLSDCSLFKCRFRCIYCMICFILNIRIISREHASGKINNLISRQTVNADSSSIIRKCIIHIVWRSTVSHRGIKFQTNRIIRERTFHCINPCTILCNSSRIPTREVAIGKKHQTIRIQSDSTLTMSAGFSVV